MELLVQHLVCFNSVIKLFSIVRKVNPSGPVPAGGPTPAVSPATGVSRCSHCKQYLNK